MRLASLIVSRKTPDDGRLEIPDEAAAHLKTLGADFALATPDGLDRARITGFTCTCGKRGDSGHEHHFLESPILAKLVPGTEVSLDIEDQGQVRIR